MVIKRKLLLSSLVFFALGFLFFSAFANTANAGSHTGDFQSNWIDMGASVNFTNFSWTADTSCSGCSVQFQVVAANATSTNPTYVGPDGTSSTYFTVSGTEIPNSLDGNRYFRYKAYLTGTSDGSATPTISDVTVGFTSFNTGDYILISSVYDTQNRYNRIESISWKEYATSTTETVRLQIRTSPDGTTWTNYVGPDGTSATYFTSSASGCSVSNGNTVTCTSMPAILGSDPADDDRYFQYKVILNASRSASAPPRVDDIVIGFNDDYIPTFTSAVIDLGTGRTFSTLTWTVGHVESDVQTSCQLNTGAGCAVKFQIAGVASTSTPFTFVGPGNDPNTYFTSTSTNNDISFLNGSRFVKYKVWLDTINPNKTPLIKDVNIGYYSSVTSGTLTSSMYDTGDSTVILGNIAWKETGTSSSATVKFQVRTAPDVNGSPGTWTGWCGYNDTINAPCDGTKYFEYNHNGVEIPSNHPFKNGEDDQWIQYRAIVSGTGVSVDDIVVTYVINAPPVVELSTPVSQSTSDGKVRISFIAADIDTNAVDSQGNPTAANPGKVEPSFQFWNGSSWQTISDTYLTADTNSAYTSTDPTPLGGISIGTSTSTASVYTAIWDVASDPIASNIATTTAKIKVTVNDGEQANATGSVTSADFVLDTKKPVISLSTVSPMTRIIGTSTTNNLIVVSSDDNDYQIMVSNDPNFTADNEGNGGVANTWLPTTIGNAVPTTLTWNFGPSPYTVYVKAKDKYQNESAVVTLRAPDNISDIFLNDITTETDYREFLSWKAISSDPEGDFNSYKVYRSTDGSNFSLLQNITDMATNYVIDTNLNGSTTYYYKITAVDDYGNSSAYTQVLSDQPDLSRGNADVTVPTISNIACVDISTSQFRVTWDTDELSNSTVYYSTDTSYSASTTVPSMVKSASSSVGGHSVVITGLNPGTTYNLRLKSTDPWGNSVVNDASNPGNNSVSAFQCTTQGGPKISNVQASSVGETKATIHWITDINSTSVVEYSTDASFATYDTAVVSDMVTDHYVNLTGLSVNTRYYYRVKSVDSNNNTAQDDNAGKLYTFTTTVDNTPPKITNVSAALTRADSAVITWVTDEPADSEVIAVTGGPVTNPGLSSVLTTKHSIVLTGLQAETTYKYKVRSKDGSAAQNSSTSAEYSFTTPAKDLIVIRGDRSKISTPNEDTTGVPKDSIKVAIDETPPIVTDLRVIDVTESSATIVWKTNEPATSLVEYGETRKYGFTSGNFEYKKEHRVVLKDLRPGREYNYQIRSIDSAGNFNESANKVFTTRKAKETIEEKLAKLDKVESIEEINALTKEIEALLASIGNKVSPPKIKGTEPEIEVGATYAIISWSTDRPSGSVVAYSEDSKYNPNFPDQYENLVGNPDEQTVDHTVKLTNLKPGTLYNFQLQSKAILGGVGKSGNFTFRTKDEAGVVDLTISDVTTDSVTLTWSTTVPATTRVEYGLSSDYSDRVSDDAFNRSHFVKLTNLKPGTLYRFRVGGVDENGNEFFSPNLTFTTEALPSLIDVKIDSVTENSAVVSWFTDLLADSVVYYTNQETGVQSTVGDKQLVKNHLVKLTNLQEGVEYRLKVSSTDEKGNTVESSEYSFKTAKDVQPPLISNVKTQSALFGRDRVQTIISWTTDEPATRQIIYQEGVAKNPALEKKSAKSLELSTEHTVVFTNFKPGSIYRFRLENIDASGNVAVSKDFTILTPQQEETVFDLIVDNFKDVFKWTEQLR